MTISELKSFIYTNSKIDFILSSLGCGQIEYHLSKNYYSACFPDGDNPQGINIKNNQYLNYRSWSRNVSYDDHEDLISLVGYVKKCSFVDALKYLHSILGIDYKWSKQPEKKPVKTFDLDDFFLNHRKREKVNVDDIRVLDEDMLNDYVSILHINWFREGIMPWTQKKFGLAYSYKRKRIIVPLRYWQDGSLMGTNARTTVENANELGIKKYFITPSYQKSINLYGLYENYQSIIDAGYCVVYEAEKSVLKRDSLNDPTGVALQGHSMSEEQIRILTGLNVDIIIAMDNDVPIDEIRYMCEKFYGIRNVYYVKDTNNFLGAKDSPADMPNKVFNYLMQHKTEYDDSEHEEYVKSLGQKF